MDLRQVGFMKLVWSTSNITQDLDIALNSLKIKINIKIFAVVFLRGGEAPVGTAFGWNCEIWLKLWYLAEIVIFGWYCDIMLILWYLADIVIFGWYCEIWLILWYLADIVTFGWYCGIWLILWYLAYIVIFGWYFDIWLM